MPPQVGHLLVAPLQ